ncbi:MAG: amidohydrolase family protein [Desulfosudaceae bacterium]
MSDDPQTIDAAVVQAGCLINGSGAPARMNVFLTVQDGKIKTVCGVKPRTNLPLMDLSGHTLLPLLVDSHVHLFMDPAAEGEDRQLQMSAGYKTLAPVIERHVACYSRYGIVAVRDGGDPGGFAGRYRQSLSAAEQERFTIKTAGRAWYKAGRYGRIVGGIPVVEKDLVAAVEEASDRVDQIKLINSGINSLSEFGRQTAPQFTAEELAAIVALARKKKKRVMVHANGELPVAEAVAAGVDSIEHGFFMGRENLERMAEKEVFWVPTAVTMQAFADLGREGGDVAARNLDSQLEQISWAREAGVRISLGTDAGSPGVAHGASVRRELMLLTRAGYSTEQAVQAATANGAALLGLANAGRLTPGMPADFIAVPGGREDLFRRLKQVSIYRAARAGR